MKACSYIKDHYELTQVDYVHARLSLSWRVLDDACQACILYRLHWVEEY